MSGEDILPLEGVIFWKRFISNIVKDVHERQKLILYLKTMKNTRFEQLKLALFCLGYGFADEETSKTIQRELEKKLFCVYDLKYQKLIDLAFIIIQTYESTVPKELKNRIISPDMTIENGNIDRPNNQRNEIGFNNPSGSDLYSLPLSSQGHCKFYPIPESIVSDVISEVATSKSFAHLFVTITARTSVLQLEHINNNYY